MPSARPAALESFARLGIPWHGGRGGDPSNHLVSSQVQCANALAPLRDDPDAVKAMFGTTLDIAEVLPIEHGWHLTFEWIGAIDHLGERLGQTRTAGR